MIPPYTPKKVQQWADASPEKGDQKTLLNIHVSSGKEVTYFKNVIVHIMSLGNSTFAVGIEEEDSAIEWEIVSGSDLVSYISSGGKKSLWRTMETAPKDGTRILAYDPNMNEIHAVEWRSYKIKYPNSSVFSEWVVPGSEQDEQGGYYSLDKPMFWMPLPEKPNL